MTVDGIGGWPGGLGSDNHNTRFCRECQFLYAIAYHAVMKTVSQSVTQSQAEPKDL